MARLTVPNPHQSEIGVDLLISDFLNAVVIV